MPIRIPEATIRIIRMQARASICLVFAIWESGFQSGFPQNSSKSGMLDFYRRRRPWKIMLAPLGAS